MAKLTRAFNRGVMDKDLDPRLVQSGTIRNAINVNVASSEGSEVGGVENELGNEKRSTINFADDTAYTLGSIAVEEVGCIYWFVNVDDAGTIENYVYEYNQDTNTTTMVLGDTRVGAANVLNFDREYRITGVNYINGMLYWTDDKNPPRRVNIQRAKSYGASTPSSDTFTAEDINVIVAPPLNAPTITLDTDPELPNNLKDKFTYFAYRYKYLDGEYSVISPFSNAAFNPSVFSINGETGVNSGMENLYNRATISYNPGGDNVTDIQLLYRDSESTNVYVIETIKKEDANGGTFVFTNNKKYSVLPSDQVTRLFDNVPLKAQAQEIIGGRLTYGNYVQFFDMKRANGEDVKMNFEVELNSQAITAPVPSVKSNRDYEVGIVYLDEYGRSTPAQTCEDNTIYVKPSLATKQNKIRVKINHEAPEFASYYRFVIKESKGNYENIFINYFIEDAGFNYLLVQPSDVNKIKVGKYLYFKTDANGATTNDVKVKATELRVIAKDELGKGLPAFTGSYLKVTSDSGIKLNPSLITELKASGEGINSNYLYRSERSGSTLGFRKKCKDTAIDTYIYKDENGQNATPSGTAFVENPILYPQVTGSTAAEGVMTISRKNEVINSGRNDARYNIVITDISAAGPQMNYYVTGDEKYIESADLTIGSTASTEYAIKDKKGNTFFYVKFSNNNTLTVGDRFVVNVRTANDKHNPGYAVGKAAVGASIGEVPGGSIIKIKATNSADRASGIPEQIFTSTKNYKNIEEWYYEDRIYKRLKDTNINLSSNAFGNNKIGSREEVITSGIFFTRGILDKGRWVKQIRNAEQLASYGDVIMCARTLMGPAAVTAVNEDCTPNVYTLQVTVTAASSQIVLETAPESIIDGIYREIPGTYSVTNGAHSGSVQNQFFNSGANIAQPAVTDLQFENCFAFGNGVESIAIRDDFNGISMTQSPRVTAEVEDYKQERVENGLTYSGVYRADSNVNKLNQFNLSLANFKYLDQNFGSVQKLHGRDTDLIVFQENKVSKVLFGKNLLSDAAGGGSIASIPQVLGTQVAFGGEYGISRNPESFATWGNMLYWADTRRNAVLRMGMDGTTPISSYGMTDYFRDSFTTTKGELKLGGYDPYNNMYVLTSTTDSVDACDIEISRNSLFVEKEPSTAIKLFTVNGTGSWTVSKVSTGDGTDWLTLGASSGTNTQDIYGTFSNNTSGNPRSMTIEVTGCSETLTFSLTQTAYAEKTIRVYVVNSEEDFGNVASQNYFYTNSPGAGVKYVDTALLEGGLALFTSNTEKVGVDKMPIPGDTVTMIAYDEVVGINGGTASPFIPGLGNKCYYYVSDTNYSADDYDTVIAAATEVTMSLTGGDYVGTFIYNAPSDEEYLYLVWDYRNLKDCAQTQSYSGEANYTPMDFEIGSDTGLIDVDYTVTSGDVTINVLYNGQIVATTGSITGPVTSAISFTKRHTTPTSAVIQILNDSLLSSAYDVDVTLNCPTLSPIDIDPTNGNGSNVCSQTPGTTYYTDGASTGTEGARIYTDSNGTTPFNGGGAFHLIDTSDNYVVVNADGYIVSKGSCNCTAGSEPTGTDANIQLYEGEEVSFRLEADETPIAWEVSTLATRYLLEGGDYGAVFNGLDPVSALYKKVAVFIGDSKEMTFVDGTVTKIQGDSGAFTRIGPDSKYALPDGLYLNEASGVISGTPTRIGSWSVNFVAINCIGTSPAFSVRFDVLTAGTVESDVTPFSIDTTNSDATSACGVTPSYDIMYHDGYYTYPVTGDKIYSSSLANSPFDGNDLWYLMNNGQTAQVDNAGIITAIVDCVQTAYTGDSFVYEANAVDTCSGTIYSYSLYYTGTLGVNPGKLYDDSGLTTLSPAGWYKAQGSSAAAYEWNGSEWTGNAYVC